jgi:4-amino-4-deoxy-L-arabinose transferase-like glycosyltransferase
VLTIAKKLPDYFVSGMLILAFGFILRAINLAYNSPFNDEAIYVVVGKMGILQWDWTTYNASSWMAGLPYFYPSMAALSYVSGGIVGARFLSVVFGVLTIETAFVVAYLLTKGDQKFKALAGLISSCIVAGSSIAIYVSRLATYDIPSFYFLFLGLAILLYTQQIEKNEAKWYFLSFVSLSLSFAIKIVSGLYIPLIVITFFLMTRAHSEKKYNLWKKYFIYPLVTLFSFYFVLNIGHLQTFFMTQAARDKADALQVVTEFTGYLKLILPFSAVGALGLIIHKQLKLLFALLLSSVMILFFHVVTHRVPTLDKHTFVSVMFLATLAGVGIASLLQHFRSTKRLQPFIIGNLFGLLALYSIVSYNDSLAYNAAWTDATGVLAYLSEEAESTDTILTEIGSAAILSTYDKVKPTQVTTFDWFVYQDLEGEEAYKTAIQDDYFSLMVLETDDQPKSGNNKNLHALIESNLSSHYEKSYKSEKFYVYKRTY